MASMWTAPSDRDYYDPRGEWDALDYADDPLEGYSDDEISLFAFEPAALPECPVCVEMLGDVAGIAVKLALAREFLLRIADGGEPELDRLDLVAHAIALGMVKARIESWWDARAAL